VRCVFVFVDDPYGAHALMLPFTSSHIVVDHNLDIVVDQVDTISQTTELFV
jgi:hypothetical protein